MQKISIVIPVYRNEGSLLSTFNSVTSVFINNNLNYKPEFVFVNDGSDDGSLDELKQIKYSNATYDIKIISFSRNFGQGPAINCGLKNTKGEAVVIMSADLQDPPKLILEMISAWEKGNKIAICYRSDREDGFIPKITSKFFYMLMKLGNNKIPDGGFDFLLLDRQVVNEYNNIDERNRFFQGDILWLGFKVLFIPYKREFRKYGKSQWTLSKKIKKLLDGLINTSYLPIRFMSLMGFCVFISGLIYSILIIRARVVNNIPFEGWAPIMITLLVLSGLIMVMLGIIGEYLWRVYDETRGRKEYIIENEY